jgi:competence protein ComEC
MAAARSGPALLVALAALIGGACQSSEPGPGTGGIGGTAAGAAGSGRGGAGGSAGTGGAGAVAGSSGAGASGGTAGSGGVAGSTGGIGGTGGTTSPADAPVQLDAGGGTETSAPVDSGGPPPAGGELLIYWVDTEGGAATVMRAPTGEIMIVDTGFPGTRDAARVMSVLQNELKATKVDYLLTTHYDPDHTGGVGYIASRLPVGEFQDHGDSGLPGGYRAAIGNKPRKVIRPGDVMMLGPVKISYVSSNRQLIPQPLPGAATTPNPHCAGADQGSGNDENAASVGFVASWGSFEFVNLGDLLWPLEHDLACPVNKLGQVELYQTTHHGQAQSGAPQLIHAMAPLVAVMNNGASKGGAAVSMRNLARSPGFQDLWQVHRSNSAGADNTADERIANSEGADQGRWLKATITSDGKFTLLNPRNMHTKTYQSR